MMSTLEDAITLLMEAMGMPFTESTAKTPSRAAKMWREFCSGASVSPSEVLAATFPAGNYDGPVVVNDIPFYSICEHHLLPFYGLATVGYLPSDRIVGLSKLPRLVEDLARMPQTQEGLTARIASALQALKPRGVAVKLTAEHMCMAMRGIKARGATTTTIQREGEHVCLS